MIVEAILAWMRERGMSDPAGLRADTPLLERGVLDSVALIRLTAHLESRYNVLLDDDDLVPENFATAGDIARLIERRMDGRG